ncbi:hypothetical protein [Pseudomonas putida]|uniref:hypothetical protein n=1 Tax=Pseudomonas putida TaxID=303 RepID=UPI002363FCF5|nr:hypothetical protein [Pseudomonas putida]MDD2145312.1 hypothetical protein [Pseudomonas putida]HDS1709453.1 hypothetical protein [Pseudomonas putida]
MRIIIKLVLFVAFFLCVVWAIMKPGFDSVTAAAISLGTFLAAFVAGNKTEPKQTQSIAENGNGIQAGRDVKIRR